MIEWCMRPDLTYGSRVIWFGSQLVMSGLTHHSIIWFSLSTTGVSRVYVSHTDAMASLKHSENYLWENSDKNTVSVTIQCLPHTGEKPSVRDIFFHEPCQRGKEVLINFIHVYNLMVDMYSWITLTGVFLLFIIMFLLYFVHISPWLNENILDTCLQGKIEEVQDTFLSDPRIHVAMHSHLLVNFRLAFLSFHKLDLYA